MIQSKTLLKSIPSTSKIGFLLGIVNLAEHVLVLCCKEKWLLCLHFRNVLLRIYVGHSFIGQKFILLVSRAHHRAELTIQGSIWEHKSAYNCTNYSKSPYFFL